MKEKFSDLNFDVEKKLNDILLKENLDIKKLQRELESLEKMFPGAVYSTLLNILTHLNFPENKAKKHWINILQHRNSMISHLRRDVDFRTALLDYFIGESKRMKNPVIVEIKLLQKTKKSVILDELTKIYNYRYFLIALKKELNRAQRYNTPLSILLLDIDNFKQYNDREGHPAGNLALRKIARVLVSSVRKVDTVTRYGGEEFAIIFPDTPKEGALTVAEKLRKKIEREKFPSKYGELTRSLTFSGGIATYPQDGETEEELIKKADEALYLAKGSGKNIVKVYSRERRAYARINSSLIGSFSVVSSEKFFLRTKNISENGILFTTNRLIPLSSFIEMHLNIPELSRSIKLKARVVRVDELRSRREYDIGVTIVEMGKKDREKFVSYLRGLAR